MANPEKNLFVDAVALSGPWAYTDLLGALARGYAEHAGRQLALLAALVVGAITGGRSLRGPQPIGPLSPGLVRSAAGGFIMGVGFSLAAGHFDGFTLLGQPLLLPFAWAAAAASYVAILLGIVYLRSRFGTWVTALRG